MRKWIQNKALEIQVKDKLEKELAKEKSLLLEQTKLIQSQLTSGHIPYKDVLSFILNEKQDLIVFTTENETFPLRLNNEKDLLRQIQYLFPYNFLELIHERNRIKFKLNIAFKGFSRFLPTLPIMRLEDDTHIWFNIDIGEKVNVKEICHFADVVVGKEKVAQDDLTYQSVLTNTLRYYSQKFGLTLHAPQLEQVSLNTALFTQINISPINKVTNIQPLRVLLSEFYHKDLELKIREYVEKVVKVLSWEKENTRFKNVINDIMMASHFDHYFKVEFWDVISDKFSFILIGKDMRFPSISFDVDYYMIRYKNTTSYFEELINNSLLNTVRIYLQKKYKELHLEERKLKIARNFDYNIGGDISFNFAYFDLLEHCIAMEIFLNEQYGPDLAKEARFSNCEGFNIKSGWIGTKLQNWDAVKRAFLKPLQGFNFIKYCTEWPDQIKKNETYEWCNHSLTFCSERTRIKCTLGKETIEIHFKNGKRSFSS